MFKLTRKKAPLYLLHVLQATNQMNIMIVNHVPLGLLNLTIVHQDAILARINLKILFLN